MMRLLRLKSQKKSFPSDWKIGEERQGWVLVERLPSGFVRIENKEFSWYGLLGDSTKLFISE